MQTAREQAAKRARLSSSLAPAPSGGASYPGFVLAADAADLGETDEAPLWARLQSGGGEGGDEDSGDSEGERAAEDAAYLAGLAARAAEAERAADAAVEGFRTARAAIVGGRASAAGAFAAERAMDALAASGNTGDEANASASASAKPRLLRVVRRKRSAPDGVAPAEAAATEPKEAQLLPGYDDVGSSDSDG